VLLRLAQVRGSLEEPLSLLELRRRAKIFEVLSLDFETSRVQADGRLRKAQEKEEHQRSRILNFGLTQAPHVGDASLVDVGQHLCQLSEQRRSLDVEVARSGRMLECLEASLFQRGMTHGLLKEKMQKLDGSLRLQDKEEQKHDEARKELRRCEEIHRQRLAETEDLLSRVKEAAKSALLIAKQEQDARRQADDLAIREVHLAEVCHSAPARVERLQICRSDSERRLKDIQSKAPAVAVETEKMERRSSLLKEARREVAGAMRSLDSVRGGLETFKRSLNSELILTDEEAKELRKLDLQLHPVCPSRLRCSQDGICKGSRADVVAADLEGVDRDSMPIWDTVRAEQDYRSNPNYRSFLNLLQERERLWHAESQWLEAVSRRTDNRLYELARQNTCLEQEVLATVAEEDQFRREIEALDDPEGHVARHRECVSAAAAAREAAKAAAREAREAEGRQQLDEARLEPSRVRIQEAEAELCRARLAAAAEADRSMRARSDLLVLTSDLEASVRSDLEEWRGVELEERQLDLTLDTVSKRMGVEAESRARLRKEVWNLIGELQELDRRLDVGATGADAGAVRGSCGLSFTQEPAG